MKRGIEIRAGVGHHVDLANLELRPLGIKRPGFLSTEEVADERGGQAAVSDHPVLNDVAQIEEHPETPAVTMGFTSCVRNERGGCPNRSRGPAKSLLPLRDPSRQAP